jgi:ferredoxin-NADP reductase/MOSC domain-containing protein YiiM
MDSYRYWQEQLKRNDFVYGQFGENFTIEGLPDGVVCIGDRFQIGTALFEVTQPRVTCYRVGIRMNEPQMAALLVSKGRPGFYFRVLKEGDVGERDEIVKVGEARERMTVAEIDALLYLPNHTHDLLERALRIDALSPGWRGSFEALLQSKQNAETGNAGLAPAAASHPVSPGFQSLSVTAMNRESEDVISLTMQSVDDHALPMALPGQYVVVRIKTTDSGPALFRSYSLSGPPSTERYRISVKIEPNGAAGKYFREHLHVGDSLDVSSPRGSFVLQAGEAPVVLLSAGIGVTPVLAMLNALATERSTRQIMWLHSARDGQHHPFVDEVRRLMETLPNGRSYVCYSSPDATDKAGETFNATGRFSQSVLDRLGLPRDADIYMCGPTGFMSDMRTAITAIGVAPERIHVEIFNGGESITPGVVGAAVRIPHVPGDEASTGPRVSFARSGISAHWNASRYASILEMAEACDVSVRWSCRTGVCHTCESGLVSGAVVYRPQPLDKPADGDVLVCCSQPVGDVVVDL